MKKRNKVVKHLLTAFKLQDKQKGYHQVCQS